MQFHFYYCLCSVLRCLPQWRWKGKTSGGPLSKYCLFLILHWTNLPSIPPKFEGPPSPHSPFRHPCKWLRVWQLSYQKCTILVKWVTIDGFFVRFPNLCVAICQIFNIGLKWSAGQKSIILTITPWLLLKWAKYVIKMYDI